MTIRQLLFLAAALSACDSGFGPFPRGPDIVYMRLDADWDLFKVPPTGAPIDSLSVLLGDEFYPTWFPDHKQVAFESARDGGGIFIMNPDGTNRRRVYGGIADLYQYRLAVSPAGDRIAFTSSYPYTDAIHVLRLADSIDVVIALGNQPTWSPDGQWIAFTAPEGIGMVRPDGSDRRTLVALPDAREPAWSPDGRWLVFSAPAPGGTLLFLSNGDGSHPRQLTFEDGLGVYIEDLGATWSPDGQWLAYQHNREPPNSYDVMLISPLGIDPHRLVSGVRPSW